jgi:hypothetical protein
MSQEANMAEMRNAYRFHSVNFRRKDNLTDLGVDGRTMIQLNLKTQAYVTLWTELKSQRIASIV